MKLKDHELMQIVGGGLTTAMINALSKAMTTILKIGQTIGTVIRRSVTKTFCVG